MPRILVVEDHADSRDALAELLRREGYDVCCASNGREALNDIISRVPDLLVLDLVMPDMDGGSLIQVLQSYRRLRAMPVVVWTGYERTALAGWPGPLKPKSIVRKGQASFSGILAAIHEALPGAQCSPNTVSPNT